MAAGHRWNLMVARFQAFDKQLFGCDAEGSLVLHLPDPGLLHVARTQHRLLDYVGDVVVYPTAQKVSFPARTARFQHVLVDSSCFVH